MIVDIFAAQASARRFLCGSQAFQFSRGRLRFTHRLGA